MTKVRRVNREKFTRFILVCIGVIALTSVAAGAYVLLHSKVYKNENQFNKFVAESFKDQDVVKTNGDEQIENEYSKGISYGISKDSNTPKYVAAFRDEKIKKIKAVYNKKNSEKELKEGEEKALLIYTATKEGNNGSISLIIYKEEYVSKNRKMDRTSSTVETYWFSKKTQAPLNTEQIMTGKYKGISSSYLIKYINDKYEKDELKKGWKNYITDSEDNLNKYSVNKGEITFYFDQGTILKKSQGVTSITISCDDIQGALRDEILARYIDPNKPMVALTYDDGPGGETEEEILDCLEENGAVATFFYYGAMIHKNPASIERACDLGCELGNHTWNHPDLTTRTPSQIKGEVSRTSEAIHDACGAYPTVFRPSYGATNEKVERACGMPVILWSIDTLDWKGRSPKMIVNSVEGCPNLDGKIVLMHSTKPNTAKATEILVPWLQARGYQLVTVSELIRYRDGENPINGKKYF